MNALSPVTRMSGPQRWGLLLTLCISVFPVCKKETDTFYVSQPMDETEACPRASLEAS